ncbi:MAG: hypothetical protein ACTHJ7_10480 [Candidatus Nitrosocosmicus sp.]
MKRGIFLGIGLALLIIGSASALFTGYIVVNSVAKPTEFQPAKAGWGNNMEPIEIGSIFVAIIGYAIFIHGLVNKEEITASSKNHR